MLDKITRRMTPEESPTAILWTRVEDESWSSARVEGVDASVALPRLGISLALADIYDDITFRPSPRLVEGEEG